MLYAKQLKIGFGRPIDEKILQMLKRVDENGLIYEITDSYGKKTVCRFNSDGTPRQRVKETILSPTTSDIHTRSFEIDNFNGKKPKEITVTDNNLNDHRFVEIKNGDGDILVKHLVRNPSTGKYEKYDPQYSGRDPIHRLNWQQPL